MDNIKEFLYKILNEYKQSDEYNQILTSYEYYSNKHDIRFKQRKAIGPNGTTQIINNIPNSKIMDNRYAILVDQKKNYLLSRPITVECEDAVYHKRVTTDLLNDKFQKTLKNVGEDSLLANMGYIYPYINTNMEFKADIFDPREILCIWSDRTHTRLESFIRFYSIFNYITDEETEVVEHYHINGITTYNVDSGKLKEVSQTPYFLVGGKPRSWGQIPLVYFKRNRLEQPLLNAVKSLQDAINEILSKYLDDIKEDSRNTIVTLKNLGGESGNLSQIRSKMNEAGIIATTGDAEVGTLDINVNPENYVKVLEILRKAIIDNGRGIDGDNEIFRSAPNQMAITSMYTEIDMDADDMITEFKVSLGKLLEFYNIANNTSTQSDITFIFNKNILINEDSAILNTKNSMGVISQRTIAANHPWVKDPDEEMNQMALEREEKISDYGNYEGAFNEGDLDGEEEA